jgi:hypothetical protein
MARWATGRKRAGRTGTSAARIVRRVTSARPSSALSGNCNGGGRPGGGGRRVREPWQRLPVAGGLCEGHRVPRAGPSGCKGGGRPGGGGQRVREPRQRVAWRLQWRWATGWWRAARTGTLAALASRRGTMRRPSSTMCRTWRLQRRWATGRKRAGRTGTSATRIVRWVTSARPSSTTRVALAVAKEVGDRAVEGSAYGNLGNAYEPQQRVAMQRRWATGLGRAGGLGTAT